MWKTTALLTIALACMVHADDPAVQEADVFDAVVYNKTTTLLESVPEESLTDAAELTPKEFKLLSDIVQSLEDSFDHGTSKIAGCDCEGSNCKCCLRINISLLPKVEACVSIEYKSKSEGFDLKLLWNGNALLTKTISGSKTPSHCIGIPKIKKVQVCIELSDISLQDNNFAVTIKLKVKLGPVKIASFKLGTIRHTLRAPDVLDNPVESNLTDELDYLGARLAFSAVPIDDELDWSTFQQLHSVARQLVPEFENTQSTGCNCQKPKCSCCVHIGALKLNADVCLSVEYLEKDFGIALELSWNGKKLVGQSVSARNPPAICIGVPGVAKALGLCFGFNDIRVSSGHFHTCPYIKIKVAFVSVFKQKLPCIDI